MNKKLSKAIEDANKEIKDSFFCNRRINVEVYPDNSTCIFLSENGTGVNWFIAETNTQSAAVIAIKAYLRGLRHGERSALQYA